MARQIGLRNFLVAIAFIALALTVTTERVRWHSEVIQRQALERRLHQIPPVTDILIGEVHQSRTPTSARISFHASIRTFPPERPPLDNLTVEVQLVEAKTAAVVWSDCQPIAFSGGILSSAGAHNIEVVNPIAGLHIITMILFSGDKEIAREATTIELR
ncbi:MAG: hypothetical protein R3C53_10120 [Pirellulaceae bacterium]